MRYLYTVLFYLALPLIFGRLLWRSIRQPDYRQRLGERLGYYPLTLDKCIWVHAVSVGEVMAAIPLVKSLQARYPQLPMLVTTMTPTGAARVRAAFGDTVTHVFIPYDLPRAMRRFLVAMHPVICLIMETELWPNLITTCHQQHIPICLVNARLSEKSARGYQRVASLTRMVLQQIDMIAAHGEVDAERFIALGAARQRVVATGNIKFDLVLPDALPALSEELRGKLGGNRFIWVAASTHEGEEELILHAHKKLLESNPNALLILVPRHPHRFDEIATLCSASLLTVRRSRHEACMPGTAIYLADTMGELLLMYSVADVAFIGGSLIPRGGHNMLEAGALAKPIVTGPHVFNFAEISELFIRAKAMTVVADEQALSAKLCDLMLNPDEREQMGRSSLEVMNANRGALAKQLTLIQRYLV